VKLSWIAAIVKVVDYSFVENLIMMVLFFQIVLAKLMDRRSIADEAVVIREECEFARLSSDVVGGEDCIEQVELKINDVLDVSTGDEMVDWIIGKGENYNGTRPEKGNKMKEGGQTQRQYNSSESSHAC
jgi:hypothetical protein